MTEEMSCKEGCQTDPYLRRPVCIFKISKCILYVDKHRNEKDDSWQSFWSMSHHINHHENCHLQKFFYTVNQQMFASINVCFLWIKTENQTRIIINAYVRLHPYTWDTVDQLMFAAINVRILANQSISPAINVRDLGSQ